MTAAKTKAEEKALKHAKMARVAANNIAVALRKGELPTIEDAKILEAAGCYIRRNSVVR